MLDEATIAQINGEYACPPEAGPVWRAAHKAGLDISLIEHTLSLTPEQRLTEHQQLLDWLLTIKGVGQANDAR
jgi:hypothetical protein